LCRASLRPNQQRLRSSKQVAQLADDLDDPILRQAIRDPVSFLGGVFAGALKLSLNEDPLRNWIERTSALAGVSPECCPCQQTGGRRLL
jgi:hypothetical protein